MLENIEQNSPTLKDLVKENRLSVQSQNWYLLRTAMDQHGERTLNCDAKVLAHFLVQNNSILTTSAYGVQLSVVDSSTDGSLTVTAGIICKLKTRTTIIAATNPKGQYDPEETICVNVALASPLLSRFDLVMVLLDNKNEEWDQVVSSYILNGINPTENMVLSTKQLWNIEKMQIYLSIVKGINPELSDNASRILQAYYRAQRCADTRNAARTTMRLLQSIIRLSQAHARLMLREVVTVQDAIVAVILMESTMQGAALLGSVNALHTAFPDNPEEEYQIQAKMVLKLLQLEELFDHLTEPVDAGSFLSHHCCTTFPPPSNSQNIQPSNQDSSLIRNIANLSFDLFNNTQTLNPEVINICVDHSSQYMSVTKPETPQDISTISHQEAVKTNLLNKNIDQNLENLFDTYQDPLQQYSNRIESHSNNDKHELQSPVRKIIENRLNLASVQIPISNSHTENKKSKDFFVSTETNHKAELVFTIAN